MAEAARSSQFRLRVGRLNRLRSTRLIRDNGKIFFGIWNPPRITLDGDEERFPVPFGQEGYLDLIAHAVYGDRQYWPFIAHVNQIDFPHEEIQPGTVVILPKKEKIDAALRAQARRAEAR